MRERQSPFTSIKYRLALMFFAITAGAIMIIYFYVVPQLESSLTSEKLQGLRKDATAYSKPLERTIGRDVFGPELDQLTRGIGEQAGAGVTLLGIPRNERSSGGEAAPPYVISDSREAVTRLEPASSTVLAAAREGKVTTATRSEGGKRLAQVAKPLYYKGEPAWVVVYSAPLSDVSDNVSLIERQILIAGGIALLVALISGYYASNALTKRLKRLEQAAGEVAAGNFSDPIPIDSEDELGQLARAFNEMQRKLAGLDQARKEFIANASHELRTPIFSLGGFMELLVDEDIDETTRSEFLTTMREQVAAPEADNRSARPLAPGCRIAGGGAGAGATADAGTPGSGRVRRRSRHAGCAYRRRGGGPRGRRRSRVRLHARGPDPASAARQRSHAHRRGHIGGG